MKQNVYNKIRNRSFIQLARRGGKNFRENKGYLRGKIKTFITKQEYKESNENLF